VTSYALLEGGWIKIPYSGPELARVQIAVGEIEPGEWRSAFINTSGGERFAQVRPMGMGLAQNYKVWLRVDGQVTLIGHLGAEPTRPAGRRRRG